MKKLFIILILFYTLISCVKQTNTVSNNSLDLKSKTETISQSRLASIQANKTDTNKELKYVFKNDTITESLSISVLKESKEYQMPKLIKFKIVLHDNLGKLTDVILDGDAQLTSPNESFTDPQDESDYFAADYSCENSQYKVKIRLDIEKYDASIVYISWLNLNDTTDYYDRNLKKYPYYDILKKE